MTETTNQGEEKAGFDYCFWAKAIVAIPLMPIVAVSAASLFEGDFARAVAAVIAVLFVLIIARKIDRIPSLQKKIVSKDS